MSLLQKNLLEAQPLIVEAKHEALKYDRQIPHSYVEGDNKMIKISIRCS